jgi:hypothetical protein
MMYKGVAVSAQVFIEERAADRLAELGVTAEILERVVRRADAEAQLCTAFDPPLLEGLTRWGRATRYLREELVPLGWAYDNPRNFARTIHPDGEFAIVITTGDELTGVPGTLPGTKYPKGFATMLAVEANVQLTFDFGSDFPPNGRDILTWFLMFHSDDQEYRVELSLPGGFAGGMITHWDERIILPPFPRQDPLVVGGVDAGESHPDVVVEVASRT